MTELSKVTLDKSTLALTFKFDCDRFLRFRLTPKAQREVLELPEKGERPGLALVTEAGRRWETEKYRDLLWAARAAGGLHVEHRTRRASDGHEVLTKVENLFDVLRRPVPPVAVIEGQFNVPLDFTPSLRQTCETYGLDSSLAPE